MKYSLGFMFGVHKLNITNLYMYTQKENILLFIHVNRSKVAYKQNMCDCSKCFSFLFLPQSQKDKNDNLTILHAYNALGLYNHMPKNL